MYDDDEEKSIGLAKSVNGVCVCVDNEIALVWTSQGTTGIYLQRGR